MSMLSSQCDRLRDRAKALRQGGGQDGLDDAALMEDAADTIWSLRDRCLELRKELDEVGLAAYLYGRADYADDKEASERWCE